jgi:hypothetical protein
MSAGFNFAAVALLLDIAPASAILQHAPAPR